MLGRNGNIAYVRYNSQGRIVPGGPIISAQRPKVGNWQPVSKAIGESVTSNELRAFVRIDAYGRVVPSSLLLLSQAPSDADSGTYWLEINATYRPFVPTTTTTTTTSGGSTTTTTTAVPSTTTTTTLIPTPTTTTTTTSAVLDCTLGAVVNTTFPGGPVNFDLSKSCDANKHLTPWILTNNFTGGSGEYTFLTYSNIALLTYSNAAELASVPVLPYPLPLDTFDFWDFVNGLSLNVVYYLVFADFNNLNNKIIKSIVFTEACPPSPPSNTVFMKFDIL